MQKNICFNFLFKQNIIWFAWSNLVKLVMLKYFNRISIIFTTLNVILLFWKPLQWPDYLCRVCRGGRTETSGGTVKAVRRLADGSETLAPEIVWLAINVSWVNETMGPFSTYFLLCWPRPKKLQYQCYHGLYIFFCVTCRFSPHEYKIIFNLGS